MQTKSVIIQSLCVPCFNRCRHCLLSWSGRTVGAEWQRSVLLAERFLRELREECPELQSMFAFGYSMEHPDLKNAIRTLRRLGSPSAEFLQCDGMRMRSDEECGELMEMLLSEGIRRLNFTVYGLAEYHDRFAGREGDFGLLMRMMRAAAKAGIPFSTGIPLTGENVLQIDRLVAILREIGSEKIWFFIPHEEGRGKNLASVRLKKQELLGLSSESRMLLDPTIYRTEGEWLGEPEPVKEDKRLIIISLKPENIEDYEKRSALSVIREIEELDEAYYSAFPEFAELAELCGDAKGEKLYRIRDLYHHYRTQYARGHDIHVYDVTDETQSGSRRF